MASICWTQLLLAGTSIVSAQSVTIGHSADRLPVSHASTTTSASIGTATINGTTTTFSIAYTPPASVDIGPNVLPNIKDPNATNAQTVCPGYKVWISQLFDQSDDFLFIEQASNFKHTEYGLTATLNLAGPACNGMPR